ncbi:MAG: glycerate kinase [Lachnospiraceae bacterium]|nr:glycerate kinase [Lachnospiraceae bacterium]
MKAVIAIDSFKGSLSSQEAGQAAAAGIKRVFPDAVTQVCPLADGGEGTVETLISGMGGTIRRLSVTGPLGESVTGRYGVLEDGVTAVLEMADAAGITMVLPEQRNPLYTTTYGVGETIRDAVKEGCRKFIIGIGGSATNDGGVGMLQALGFEFLDGEGKPVAFGAQGLEKLVCIGTQHAMEELAECEFHIACDVKNALCGPEGCSAVFGPQKGADDAMIRKMDAWLADYAALAAAACEGEAVDPDHPGSGAAGGLGFAFRTFLHGSLEPGVELILRETKLEEKLRDADVVVTGEGRLDGQTVMGKAPVGVAALAKKHGKRVVAFSGCVTEDARECNAHGIDAFFPIVRGAVSLEEAMDRENAARNMTDTVEQVFRLMG